MFWQRGRGITGPEIVIWDIPIPFLRDESFIPIIRSMILKVSGILDFVKLSKKVIIFLHRNKIYDIRQYSCAIQPILDFNIFNIFSFGIINTFSLFPLVLLSLCMLLHIQGYIHLVDTCLVGRYLLVPLPIPVDIGEPC